jgi:hypothetical protein
VIAAKQPRPGATGQQHGVAGDATLFGHSGNHPPSTALHPAYGAAGENSRTQTARRLGDSRGGFLRLGAPVAFRVKSSAELGRCPGHQSSDLIRPDHARVELIRSRVLQPGFPLGDVGVGLAEVHDPGGTEAGFATDRLVHSLPEPEALDDQRQLARIPPHLAAPAPIPARLLAGDFTFFAQHDGDTFARQRPSSADADDPTAGNHHRRARRHSCIRCNRIDMRSHRLSPPEARAPSARRAAPPGW